MMTSIFNPIITNEAFKPLGLFEKKPTVQPNTVKVFIGADNNVFIYKEGTTFTRGELNSKMFTRSYDIDISSKDFSIEFELDSIDPIEKFKVKVEATLSVGNPALIITSNVTNIFETAKIIISRRVENVTLSNNIEKYMEAQKVIDEIVNSKEIDHLLAEHGISAKFLKIRLLLSDENLNKLKIKRQAEENKMMQTEKELESKKKELADVDQQLELKRARLKAETILEKDKRELQSEVAITEDAQKMSKLELEEKMRRKRFETIIDLYKRGGETMVMAYYASDPEELAAITAIFNEARRVAKENREEIIKYLSKLKDMGIDERESFDIINTLNNKVFSDPQIAFKEDKAKLFLKNSVDEEQGGIDSYVVEE